MTDNEIVKALECCDGSFDKCGECPLDSVNQDKLRCWELEKSALDLINRQKAEIERLQKELKITRAYIHDNGLEWGLVSHLEFYKNQRAEAIKEFAERVEPLKKFRSCMINSEYELSVTMREIDDILKEMVDENNA